MNTRRDDAEDAIVSEIRGRRRMRKLIAAAVFSACITAIGMAAALIMLVGEAREQREGAECRFDISTDVNRIKDDIDIAVARIIEASVLIDQPDTPPEERERLTALIPDQAAVIRESVRELIPASERRDEAVEICRGVG